MYPTNHTWIKTVVAIGPRNGRETVTLPPEGENKNTPCWRLSQNLSVEPSGRAISSESLSACALHARPRASPCRAWKSPDNPKTQAGHGLRCSGTLTARLHKNRVGPGRMTGAAIVQKGKKAV